MTKAQEAAMLAGCLDRWDIPAAKPWNYDQYGNPRPQLKRRLEPER